MVPQIIIALLPDGIDSMGACPFSSQGRNATHSYGTMQDITAKEVESKKLEDISFENMVAEKVKKPEAQRWRPYSPGQARRIDGMMKPARMY